MHELEDGMAHQLRGLAPENALRRGALVQDTSVAGQHGGDIHRILPHGAELRLRTAEFLAEQHLFGNLGMQDHGAAVGPAQRPGDEPEPCFPGRSGAGVIQGEVGRRAAHHGLNPHGRFRGPFRGRARGRPADSQVVDAQPAPARAGGVFAGGLAPGLVSQDDRAVAVQHANPFAQRVEGDLNEFVGLDGLT